MTRLSLSTIVLLFAFSVVRADDPPKTPTKPAEPTIEVKLTDDSVVKLTLLESTIDFVTPHGKLTIPVGEVRRIDLGLRIPDDVAAQIKTAIVDLGNPQFRKREEATALLLKYREKSYPSLKEATKLADAEVTKRVEELIEKLEAIIPRNRLEVPEHDVIHTDLSHIAGKILNPTMRARSFTFGDVPLKLADVVAMSVNGFKEKDDAVAALPDPGSMTNYGQPQHIGKTYVFRVTGVANGSLWGTGTYTLDSNLATAAVHMGIVKVGQTGNVKVTILPAMAGFVGSTQNGVSSSPYANYPGAYQIHAK
jgi:LCCL domain